MENNMAFRHTETSTGMFGSSQDIRRKLTPKRNMALRHSVTSPQGFVEISRKSTWLFATQQRVHRNPFKTTRKSYGFSPLSNDPQGFVQKIVMAFRHSATSSQGPVRNNQKITMALRH
jgi:uncharacterized Fe-S cluster-containing radical SAM superfamily protein